MFTSDNRSNIRRVQRNQGFRSTGDLGTAFIYIAVSIATALFGAVYEHFSFGVWSVFMVYAFMIPLAGGAVPFMIIYMRKMLKNMKNGLIDTRAVIPAGKSMITGRELYHAAIATLTIGSIIKGVLDIYGTTNRLLTVYVIAGAVMIIAAVVTGALEARENRAVSNMAHASQAAE